MQSMLPPEELREQFSRRRFRQFLLIIPAIAATIALRMEISATVAVIGLAVIIAAVVYTLFNWRCPACNAYIGRAINPKQCRKCTFAFRS